MTATATPNLRAVIDALRGFANHTANGGPWELDSWQLLANSAADALDVEYLRAASAADIRETLEHLTTYVQEG